MTYGYEDPETRPNSHSGSEIIPEGNGCLMWKIRTTTGVGVNQYQGIMYGGKFTHTREGVVVMA